MRTLLKLGVLAVLVAAGLVAWGLYVPTGPAAEQFVLLKPGSPARKIARELKANGLIRSEWAFIALHAWKAKTLKAGEYKFDHPANAIAVYDRIARGDIFAHTVTIPEGYNMFEVATLMEQAGLGPRADFLKVAKDTALIADLDPQAKSLEGYLFPDTYEFTRTQTMRDMAAAMVRRFRQNAQQIGLAPTTADVHRVVTMASIVEKETSVPEERPVVAGVYYNRLEKNVALGADPTVVYASLLIGKYDGVIRVSDLQLDSPYNTYKVAGMPPGPIANPGRAALEAAMHPAKTAFLYFVSDNQGHHRFAATGAEHARNVDAYRRATAPR
ncbi:MAG: endolytic transglycosylase MltG [Candidatus Koribacter versatilis]|uniref:Endolytic murein transglycosylase n=1 Tax=Candidatus Korobacter versatilis TaxID=658062 RepID=A0A932ER15_9BACT|nr:endolytic transglycosylase MltG [Candidatus Koribacter versatilis]